MSDSAIPQAVARQVPLSMGFSRLEYWSGLQFPSPGDLPDPGIGPESPASPALAGRFFTTGPPGKPVYVCVCVCVCVKLKVKAAQLSLTFCNYVDYSPWNPPGQNTGVGSLSLLQGIFPTQGSYSGLPHYRRILYQLSHKGSPRILEWVAHPFSRGSAWPRNWTGVSCHCRWILYQLS